MGKKSFEEQFPGYEIIAEKKSWWAWPLVWLAAVVLLVGVPGLVFYRLSLYAVPTPNMAGVNKFTVATAGAMASTQAQAGQYAAAVLSFQRYFAMGGQEADLMALYAYSLSELGRKDEAVSWARKALATAPDSKAARLIHDSLEPKKF